MPASRKKCIRCGIRRQLANYATERARVCLVCKRKRVRRASRGVRLSTLYGLTLEEYETLLQAQGGVCAICKGKRPYQLDVDHDHNLERLGVPARECIRGLLCKACNRRLLPNAKDSTEVLVNAIGYLEDPPARKVLR